MFTDFFYMLRKHKVPISLTEWMVLMEALDGGYIADLNDFYFLARAILIKSEAYFDNYDVAFQEYFTGVSGPMEIPENIIKWTRDALEQLKERFGDLPQFDDMTFEELMKEFEKRLKEQKEQHDGGNHWIGRGGTSPFGNSGYRPGGIRVGGQGGGMHAMKVASERRFRNYRNDMVLDVRQTKIALKGIRQLTRIGLEDELDLEGTIDKVAKNAGEIELIWQRSRKNNARVLLLMDTGGSMDPYAALCSQLFTAAHSSNHFRDFQYYYFHNCVYQHLYKNMERRETIDTEKVLHNLEGDYKLIIVGDAMMGQWELTEKNGAISYFDMNDTPGVTWLRRLESHFTHGIWLNPYTDERYWHNTSSISMIGKIFPMYPLTVDGLNRAVKKLTVKR
jgi:uncharacterized protein